MHIEDGVSHDAGWLIHDVSWQAIVQAEGTRGWNSSLDRAQVSLLTRLQYPYTKARAACSSCVHLDGVQSAPYCTTNGPELSPTCRRWAKQRCAMSMSCHEQLVAPLRALPQPADLIDQSYSMIIHIHVSSERLCSWDMAREAALVGGRRCGRTTRQASVAYTVMDAGRLLLTIADDF